MKKKIIVYYIHSFDVEDTDKLFKDESTKEVDLQAVKDPSQVVEYSVEDFVHALNTQQIDSYGVFAYEEVDAD